MASGPAAPMGPRDAAADGYAWAGGAASHIVHRSTSTITAGPGGRRTRYWGYLTVSAATAESRSGPSSTTRAAPSARTHHSRSQSSSYRSTSTLARGSARMFSRRWSALVLLGLPSTTETIRSSIRANVHGTTWGRPVGWTVARWATRARANRRSASACFTIAPLEWTSPRFSSGSGLPAPSCRERMKHDDRSVDHAGGAPRVRGAPPVADVPARGTRRRDRHARGGRGGDAPGGGRPGRLTAPSVGEDALEAQQELLAGQATGVAAEAATRVQDAVARDHDRDRIGTERVAGRSIGAVVPGLARDRSIRRHRSERHASGGLQDPLGEPSRERPVDPGVEPPAVALEVLVELASDVVERRRGLQHARRDPRGEVLERRVERLVGVRQADEAPAGRCDQQRPERGLDRGVGDVEQARGAGGGRHGRRRGAGLRVQA